MHGAEKEALEGFENNVKRGDQQKRGFDEGGEIFKLAVAVWMTLIGGLIGNAHRQKCDDRGDQIEPECSASDKIPKLPVRKTRNAFSETSTIAEPTLSSAACFFSRTSLETSPGMVAA